MTYTEKAIQKAREGGYENLTVSQYNLFKDGKLRWQIYTSDPLFWQSLGKAQGWWDGFMPAWRPKGQERKPEWIEQRDRFIGHLDSGQDAESFFKKIILK